MNASAIPRLADIVLFTHDHQLKTFLHRTIERLGSFNGRVYEFLPLNTQTDDGGYQIAPGGLYAADERLKLRQESGYWKILAVLIQVAFAPLCVVAFIAKGPLRRHFLLLESQCIFSEKPEGINIYHPILATINEVNPKLLQCLYDSAQNKGLHTGKSKTDFTQEIEEVMYIIYHTFNDQNNPERELKYIKNEDAYLLDKSYSYEDLIQLILEEGSSGLLVESFFDGEANRGCYKPLNGRHVTYSFNRDKGPEKLKKIKQSIRSTAIDIGALTSMGAAAIYGCSFLVKSLSDNKAHRVAAVSSVAFTIAIVSSLALFTAGSIQEIINLNREKKEIEELISIEKIITARF